MKRCLVCGAADNRKPMCFRGHRYCSELHRKVVMGEYGYSIDKLVHDGHITKTHAVRLWAENFQANNTALQTRT